MLTGIQSSDEGQQLQSVIEMCQVITEAGNTPDYSSVCNLMQKIIVSLGQTKLCSSYTGFTYLS